MLKKNGWDLATASEEPTVQSLMYEAAACCYFKHLGTSVLTQLCSRDGSPGKIEEIKY